MKPEKTQSQQNSSQEREHLFDKPENVRRVIRLLVAVCVLLFGLDFILHRHSSHPWEYIPGFYAYYGFIGCVLLVVIAKWLRLVVKRPEDYYRQEEQDNGVKREQENKEGGSDVAP
ncbi:hypothetical protein SG34_030125 [Thalassomonas viridans]|uniref:Uncharacterized protein n=1 Tax=Thalassomonas viridans TaxID=137584 RepID=A0AAE9Z986_9GAMM|nr:hypothetical protein [Thalassomonas viridans]WDE09036.1 hypothetical protein SG34_030125 [Thalassomonas viridans]